MTENKSSTMTGETPKRAESTPCEPEIKIHEFSGKLLDTLVNFHVVKMADSLYIWVGTEPKLVNLALAMQTKFLTFSFNVALEKIDPILSPMPCATTILGDSEDSSVSTSGAIAQKLAKRTKKQVFLSYNTLSTSEMVSLVEVRLVEEMKAKPECF